MLENSGIGMLEAARIIIAIQNNSGRREPLDLEYCIRAVHEGCARLKRKGDNILFSQAIEALLESKRHRRKSTLTELRYYTRAIVSRNPRFAQTAVQKLEPEDCGEMLSGTFANAHTRSKARVILHGVMSFCLKRGWIERNPVDFIREEPLDERAIRPLSLDEIDRLLATSLTPEHRLCAPVLGLMLWAGIRPAEAARLRWSDVRLKTRAIVLQAYQSKTRGSRCVTMHPVLAAWLARFSPGREPHRSVCPPNWKKRWRLIHRDSGFRSWVPDVLRHTFATYHAVHFRNLENLQYEMGHRSLQLLRCRYLATGDVTSREAREFWSPGFWKSKGKLQPPQQR